MLIGAVSSHFQQSNSYQLKQMTDAINSTIELFIVVALYVIDAFETLLSGLTTGVMKEEKILPPKKSTKELSKMLKKDLVELVLAYQV